MLHCGRGAQKWPNENGFSEHGRAITPVVVPTVIPFRNLKHRELFLSGLRLAVGEETGALETGIDIAADRLETPEIERSMNQ